eukprot:TRINITY_DN7761_c0_g1_i2.p1 TRINITY_DN7761_c0_g1~~TRINITY_DN7761_c0_g1_i2.p1  ORF type:complete len:302 (+),score=100.78 TRINITY_DN7761_c0_g1_i2:86-991(+)
MAQQEPLVVVTHDEASGVTTLRLNNPKRCNALSPALRREMLAQLQRAAEDPACKAAVITGTGEYYCSGVDFAGSLKPMHPYSLVRTVAAQSQALFEPFINFPKPLVAAVNGPAMGAACTSLLLCDVVIASQRATFHTPFAALGLPPEGCSSLTFSLVMGQEHAQRMLGPEGWAPSAGDAFAAGFVDRVVTDDKLLAEAQSTAAQRAEAGTARRWAARTAELREVNRTESAALARAFVSLSFLRAQEDFLTKKKKAGLARLFRWARYTWPLWRPLAYVSPEATGMGLAAVIALVAGLVYARR